MKPHNPYAFPSHGSMGEVVQEGMSLRDYFIAHAPASEIQDISPQTIDACADFLGMPWGDYSGGEHYVLVLAKARRMWADAMLAEREKDGPRPQPISAKPQSKSPSPRRNK